MLEVVEQGQTLDWLAAAHARAEATAKGWGESRLVDLSRTMRRRFTRFGCLPPDIRARGTVVPDFLHDHWEEMAVYPLQASPSGAGTAARNALFAEATSAYFEAEYGGEAHPPDDLIHVTCTGYVSPSAPQELVAARRWPTRVVHAYHMGCYAAIPAIRIAAALAGQRGRVDVVHTELCTLHLDPSDHSPEQLVVQSLFADGLIRYSVRGQGAPGPGLRIVALDEAILPDSVDSMRWSVGDHGLHMTLGRDVPDRIADELPGFLAGLAAETRGRPIFAVHPGGPKIIERVQSVLGLDEAQVAASRAVLAELGNMSSATLPHIWARLVADPAVAAGTPIVSLAFGPGLTVAGALFRKE